SIIPETRQCSSTIVGGMTHLLTRKAAAVFSFFMALPMMIGTSVVKLYKFFQEGYTFTPQGINVLIIGNLVGFVVAIVAIRSFIGYLSKYGFKVFGWYRIVVGLIIIVLILSGQNLDVI